MQFTKLGDLDVVTRITGPHHHFLGIQFSPWLATTPVLEVVSRDGNAIELVAPGPGEACYREVVDGVSEANDRLGTNYSVQNPFLCG